MPDVFPPNYFHRVNLAAVIDNMEQLSVLIDQLRDVAKSLAEEDATPLPTDHIKPHINMNGTSKHVLTSDRLPALNAMRDALSALKLYTPHGRDYQGGGNYARDLAIWKERYRVIHDLAYAMEQEALEISRHGEMVHLCD